MPLLGGGGRKKTLSTIGVTARPIAAHEYLRQPRDRLLLDALRQSIERSRLRVPRVSELLDVKSLPDTNTAHAAQTLAEHVLAASKNGPAMGPEGDAGPEEARPKGVGPKETLTGRNPPYWTPTRWNERIRALPKLEAQFDEAASARWDSNLRALTRGKAASGQSERARREQAASLFPEI
ncbi:hypothetical protein GNI_057210, partial [Gregarina niphandrodes]